MLQSLLVAAIVLVAIVHAGWHLLPVPWRQTLAKRLAGRPTPPTSRHGLMIICGRLLQRALRTPNAGCADCGGRARCPMQQVVATGRRVDVAADTACHERPLLAVSRD